MLTPSNLDELQSAKNVDTKSHNIRREEEFQNCKYKNQFTIVLMHIRC